MYEIYCNLVLILNVVLSVSGIDVLGCGGFAKSHVPIDFSKVEVKLVTKQGIVKDKTNCAPNNGYYFLPLYEKGEYILELEPPPGWSFNPNKVNLQVDGEDSCSKGKDINFIFQGFGITGRVENLGDALNGPEGINVELKSGTDVRSTVTKKGGSFFFTPVYPGKYTLRITHPRWVLHKNSVDVVVTEGNTELPKNSLVLHGYDVKGYVKSQNNPIRDAVVFLFRQPSNKQTLQVLGCEKEGLALPQNALCFAKTNQNGQFTFGSLPVGDYSLRPHFLGQNTFFEPMSIDFSVTQGSVEIPKAFEIVGFSVTGRVLKSNNVPLGKAQIFLNGVKVTETDANGVYKLEKLKSGSYKLKIEADNLIFDETTITISPGVKELPEIYPSAYKICGKVISETSQRVSIVKIGSTFLRDVQSDPKTGIFCEHVPKGAYEIQVGISASDRSKGMQFFPLVQKIDVSSENLNVATFSRLKAKLSGTVQCLNEKDCAFVKVLLRQSGADENDAETKLSGNAYSFNDIYPGAYDIVLVSHKLCWKSETQSIVVNSATQVVPPFIQTGFSLTFVSSHSTKVTYQIPGETRRAALEITKGRASYCVEKHGSYVFELESCHTYETNKVTYDTQSGVNELFLNAAKHLNRILISSNKKLGDVTASVKIDGDKTEHTLSYENGHYVLEVQLAPETSAIIIPHSDILYFEPPIKSVSSKADCADLGVLFKAIEGKVFKGKVTPVIPGVQMNLEADNGEQLTTETDALGAYSFPPLDATKTYKISAVKESYVLVGPDEKGNFVAHKLAEVIVEVLDEADKTPLQGALLSLSGGSSYRSNLQTNKDGKISFHSLSPNEYYLRPMMKEYSFEPNSKIINVLEGATVNVQLVGKRVAYSAYGRVTTLNASPEENIIVYAIGTGNCSHFSEESVTESDGRFRIRGLQPYCSYDFSVRLLEHGTDIERSLPNVINKQGVTADITDLKITVFRQAPKTHVVVKVLTQNPDHYKSLRIKVSPKSSPSSILHSIKVDTGNLKLQKDYDRGILVNLPEIPNDGKSYVVQLDSASTTIKWSSEPQSFVANSSFKFVQLEFEVKSNATDQNIKQTSAWTLVLIFSLMVAGYNIEQLLVLVKDRFSLNINIPSFLVKKHSANDYPTDNTDIDKIVQSINAVKRKPKPKKA